MEAASFGQTDIVKCLLEVSDLELDAVNIRGQTAAEVAVNRSKINKRLRINTTIGPIY